MGAAGFDRPAAPVLSIRPVLAIASYWNLDLHMEGADTQVQQRLLIHPIRLTIWEICNSVQDRLPSPGWIHHIMVRTDDSLSLSMVAYHLRCLQRGGLVKGEQRRG